MYYRNKWAIILIFVVIDILVFTGIFYLAFQIRDILTPLIGRILLWRTQAPMAQMTVILGIITFFGLGLYPGYGLTAVKELEKMSKATTLVFFLLASASYLNKSFQEFSRSIMLIAWILAIIILPIVHFILRNLLSRTKWYGTPVIIFGDGAWATQIKSSLRAVRRLGWQVKDVVPINDIDTYQSQYGNHLIAILALSADTWMGNTPRKLSQYFRKLVLIQETEYFGSLWVKPLDLDSRLGLEFNYHLLEWPSRLLKLLVDYIGAAILLILFFPFFALISLLIRIDSPGPVIFTQKRLGKDFKEFYVFKFRTMEDNAEQSLQELLQSNPKLRAEYEQFHKLEGDPRRTKIGRFLRRFSIDELPQLLNVLKGEMSLVGPRAYLPSELSKMGTYDAIILRVKPSLTGWWQVMGHNETTFKNRLQMDEYYISNWSLWMDIFIMFKTLWVVIKGTGV
jgi:Undecaprenyl-phosphate galactose phosphotransferase WbaP